MGDKDDSLYLQLYTQLVSKLKLHREDDFRLLQPYLDWWWPEPALGYIDPNAYLFLSRMPTSKPSGEVPLYESTDKNLYSTYRSVLMTTPQIGSEGNWITEYQSALTESEKPSSPSEDKPGFVRMMTNAGTVVSDNYVVANGKDWISELKRMAGDGTSREEKRYDTGKDVGFNGVVQNLTIDLSTEYAPMSRMIIPRSQDAFFGVFAASNEWESLDIAPNDKISVSITFGAVSKVPVQPDPHWYSADFLHTLAERDSWNPPFTRSDIFGENGLLNVMLNGFTAAYHISYKVKTSPDTFKKYEARFVAARGFRIGPFNFGAGIPTPITEAFVTTESPAPADWKHTANPDTCTFEGRSMADFPTVVGATVNRIVPDN